MHYSNLRNDEREASEAGASRNISVSSDDILKKKESYWFLALVVFLIVAGSIIFYCAHTGGYITCLNVKKWINSK